MKPNVCLQGREFQLAFGPGCRFTKRAHVSILFIYRRKLVTAQFLVGLDCKRRWCGCLVFDPTIKTTRASKAISFRFLSLTLKTISVFISICRSTYFKPVRVESWEYNFLSRIYNKFCNVLACFKTIIHAISSVTTQNIFGAVCL